MGGRDPVAGIQDGRRRKGERRRRLILDATMRVIERGGATAVTQRAVAAEAQLPPSAVTYYFPTIDELLVAALTACNDRYIDELERVAGEDDERALRRLAELIADSSGDNRVQVAAELELFLMAARRRDVRHEVARWNEALDAFVARFVDDPAARAGVTAAIDGLFQRCITTDDPPDADDIVEILQRLSARPGSSR